MMLLYTETAFHHQGDLDYLTGLIDASRDCGADGVKFQVLTQASNLISTRHSAYPTLSTYVFTPEQWETAFAHARRRGLRLVLMPLDQPAFTLVDRCRDNIEYLEIHPVCLNDWSLLEGFKRSGLPLILGMGGRTVEEVREWQDFFGSQLAVLMCGFQAFPSRLADVKLERIAWLRSLFPDLTIGYADHSGFDDPDAVDSNSLAWRWGARLFEKHITTTEGVSRVDYESAVGPEKIARIVSNLRRLQATGEPPLEFAGDTSDLAMMTEAELTYRKRSKVAVATRNLEANHVLTKDDLALKMIDQDGGCMNASDLVGKKLISAVQHDELIPLEKVK